MCIYYSWRRKRDGSYLHCFLSSFLSFLSLFTLYSRCVPPLFLGETSSRKERILLRNYGSGEVLPLSSRRKQKIACRQPVTYPRSSLKFSASKSPSSAPLSRLVLPSCSEKFPTVESIPPRACQKRRLFIRRVGNRFLSRNHSFVTRRSVPKTKDFRVHGSLLRRAGLRSAKQT